MRLQAKPQSMVLSIAALEQMPQSSAFPFIIPTLNLKVFHIQLLPLSRFHSSVPVPHLPENDSNGCNLVLHPLHFSVVTRNRRFEKKTDRFWKFSEQAEIWVEVELPYDLVSCDYGECSEVNKREESLDQEHEFDEKKKSVENNKDVVLPLRKRISLTKMSETSIWVTGESGSIYERYWNRLEWVIAPHDLPISVGRAIAVFIINRIILALFEAGNQYQVLN
ncbi:hypothetical protein RIF29_29825 [Crotalaria pallida]|uniref:Uncharacterized protein n=1 Tax=Crotalaria pallida TaxID=3830 RepID=A0AAN9EF81_CROPI